MRLAAIVERYQGRLSAHYGNRLTLAQRHALSAIRDCRTERCGEVLLDCPSCDGLQSRFLSCGHRSWSTSRSPLPWTRRCFLSSSACGCSNRRNR